LLPEGVVGGGGKRLRFVEAEQVPGVEYERHVFETGEVPTRDGSWHDFYNALAWCRWPRLKAAMNAVHYRHLDEAGDGRRGAVRDALTLLDESGALVVSRDAALLEALAARDWQRAFLGLRERWSESVCLLCGHALLEKLRAPYKAVTAHALLLRIPAADRISDPGLLRRLDAALAEALLAGVLLPDATRFSPLPLAGVPLWWSAAPQDEAFYADRGVFRPPREDAARAAILKLETLGESTS